MTHDNEHRMQMKENTQSQKVIPGAQLCLAAAKWHPGISLGTVQLQEEALQWPEE